MLISDLTNSGAIPTLEASMRFASQRQRYIAGNIANITTPDYIQRDVSVGDFRKELGRAIDVRRATTGGERGALRLRNTQELRVTGPGAGDFDVEPTSTSGNVLFHDRNNRDVEELMRDGVETVQTFRFAAELLRGRFEMLKSAIAQRP